MGRQFSIYLDESETKRLMEIAVRECRRPQDQVRYILRTVLLGEQSQENKSVVDGSTVTIVMVDSATTSTPS